MNPDLTRSERETQKLLRDELKARRDKGEADLIIRGNRIVKRRGNGNVGRASGSSRTMETSAPPSDQHQPQSDQPMESDENNNLFLIVTNLLIKSLPRLMILILHIIVMVILPI